MHNHIKYSKIKQIGILFFISFSISANAQFTADSVEIPLVQPDKTWFCYDKRTKKNVIYRIANDTLINDTLYFKVFVKQGQKQQENFYGLVTMATKNNLLLINEKNEKRYYYQFPLYLNDTILSCWRVVDIEEIELNNGIYVNKYTLKNEPKYNEEVIWIEGIGDLGGLFYSYTKFFDRSCLFDSYKGPEWIDDLGSEIVDSVYLNGELFFKRSMLDKSDGESRD